MKINATKIGCNINVSINGILHKTTCKTKEDAKELYDFILEVKNNPIDENVNKLLAKLNVNIRKSMEYGLDYDPNMGEYYLNGFNVPVPEILVDLIKEYHEEGYPKEPILNFWGLLMLNLDKRVRNDLFKFIQTHDFVLTDKGYLLVYKFVMVNKHNNIDSKLKTFVYDQYKRIKKVWKRSPKNYVVYKEINTNDEFLITKGKTFFNWNQKEKGVELIGNLDVLFNEFEENTSYNTNDETLYTDNYTKKMRIKIGVPVKMDRPKCDSDPTIECSSGLHVGATKYVESYGRWHGGSTGDTAVLICLVNPAHVVAVPQYDNSKIRVSEYFPIGTVEYDNHRIKHIEQKYYENDYSHYEQDNLIKLLDDLKSKEGVRNLDLFNIKDVEYMDIPSSDEYEKIIKNRIVKIK